MNGSCATWTFLVFIISFVSPVGLLLLTVVVLRAVAVGLFRRVAVTENSLCLKDPFRRERLIPLDAIQKAEVFQTRLDRVMRTGALRLSLEGEASLCLRRLADPYAFWKRLKIARFHHRKAP